MRSEKEPMHLAASTPSAPNPLVQAAALLPAVQLIDEQHARRSALETYIHDRFAREYGADINSFMPWLIALQTEQQFQAAIGFRPAGQSALFLETYLRQAVEHVLAQITQLPVERDQIVEVGNLAATQAGSSASLFCALASFLDHCHYQWVVISATPTVQNVFSKLGIPLIALAEALPQALPAEQRGRWGSYYECHPVVMAVHVKTAHRCVQNSRLGKHMLRAIEPSLQQLIDQWQELRPCL
jgi:hypothetical protein